MPEYDRPHSYRRSGTIGLRNEGMVTPIWDPPSPSGVGIEATPRWPWQFADSRYHIEISTMAIAWRVAIGLILLGIALRLWNAVTARNQRDRFVTMAWSCSIGTLISILGLMVFGAFTAGYGLIDSIVVGALSAGIVFGLVYGRLTFQKEPVRRSWLTVTQFAWFALGLFVAAILMIVAGNVASNFRGPSQGVTVLGTANYMHSQTLVNVCTGVGVAVTGIAIAWWVAWMRWPRGLVAGIGIGAILLGIAFALSF